MRIFDDFLDAIKKRPLAFIRKKYITYLETLINGYFIGRRASQIYSTRLFPLDFWFMHEFARIKYNESSSCMGWCSIILNNCNGDKETAFDRFFEIYDEFRQLRMTECVKYALTEDNIDYNNSMEHCCSMSADGKKPVFSNPLAVYLAELTDNTGWIMVVETYNQIKSEHRIFGSREKAVECAEIYFGRLSESIIEISGDNIDFGKNIL